VKTTIDEGFIGRVYKSSAYLAAIGVGVCWMMGGPYAAAGWTVGALVSTGILASLEWVIRRSFVPGATRARSTLAKFSLAKLPLVLLVLGLVVWLGRLSTAFLVAFCAGVLLTQTVITMKALGIALCERLNTQ